MSENITQQESRIGEYYDKTVIIYFLIAGFQSAIEVQRIKKEFA